jgi:hypothetical protein
MVSVQSPSCRKEYTSNNIRNKERIILCLWKIRNKNHSAHKKDCHKGLMSKQGSSRTMKCCLSQFEEGNCDRRMEKQRAWGLRVQNLRLNQLTEVLPPDTTHTRAHTSKQIGDSNRGGRGGGGASATAADLVLQNSHSKHVQAWNKSLVARKIASQETLSFSNNKQLAS